MKKKRFSSTFFVLLVFAFLYLPIIVLIIYSFNKSSMNILFEGFTFDWYKRKGFIKDKYRNKYLYRLTKMIWK